MVDATHIYYDAPATDLPFLELSICLREPNNMIINIAVRHTYKNNEIVLNGLKKLDKEAVPKVNAAVGNT